MLSFKLSIGGVLNNIYSVPPDLIFLDRDLIEPPGSIVIDIKTRPDPTIAIEVRSLKKILLNERKTEVNYISGMICRTELDLGKAAVVTHIIN